MASAISLSAATWIHPVRCRAAPSSDRIAYALHVRSMSLPSLESHRLALDIERWIGSPGRRAVLVTSIVLLCALGTTIQTAETLELRKREYDWNELYTQQLCLWAPWGLLGGPLFVAARSIFRMRRSWVIAALVQAPLSILVAYVFQLYEDALANVVFLDTWLAPQRAPGQVAFRF